MSIKILVADTKEQISREVKEQLSFDSKYQVFVTDSEDVFNETLKSRPDIVFIDCGTITEKSVESLKSLKQSDETLGIPVLLLTEFSENCRMNEAFDYGIVDFVRKPLVKEELIMRIEALVHKETYLTKIYKEIEHLEELSIVAKKSGSSVAIISNNEKIEWVNEGFEKMYGYTYKEFVDNFESFLFSEERDSDFHKAVDICTDSHESYVYENSWKTKEGRTIWIQTTLSPILNEQNEVVKFIAVETDITDLKIAEERLGAKNDHLLSLTEHLESTNELLEKQRKEIEQQKEFIEEQKKDSDKLLLNILPFEIAEQLKKKGFAKSKNYKMVSVMFTDFKDFSKLSEKLSTQDLITELNIYFEKFDEIIEEHFIEKIKTIGDAYMCVGGLPLRNKSNPIDVTLAGLKVQKFMRDYANMKREKGEPVWELRLGIHTGEVIAGVIGKKKFAYDIWGDTVNTAARMQEAGDVGKVNISGPTYEYIKDFFECTYRGKMAVKNMGETDMYFVNRLKKEFSEDPEGIIPNMDFRKILAKY